MIYQMAYHLMLNYLLTILLYFQLCDINTSTVELNSDLKKINDWAFQWKMAFNTDRSKQAQEIMFSRKLKKETHPPCFSTIIMFPRLTFKHILGLS